jgi:CubicO group peptidase (beta-lactamase class C family)
MSLSKATRGYVCALAGLPMPVYGAAITAGLQRKTQGKERTMFTRELALVLCLCTAPTGSVLPAQEPALSPVNTTVAHGATVTDAPEVREALQLLNVWLEGQCLKDDLPGMAVGVVHDQNLIWSKGYGYADVAKKIPTTDQTLYRVASISKLFTATAVTQLIEHGKLLLEEPVAKHLPWFTPKDADPKHSVLVWHLLTHTGGLRREMPETDFDRLHRPDAATVQAATPETPLTFPPQTRQKYSNYAFQVAGLLVSELSGTPFPRYVEEHILRPLGMANSRLLDGNETCPGLAVPYGRRLPDAQRTIESQVDNSGLLAAGGLVTSVRDLAKFASLQFMTTDDYTGPVLTGWSLRDMHRPRWLAPDWSRGNGISWFLIRRGETIFLGHGGSLPGYKSNLLIDPAGKVAVIILINADDGRAGELAKGVMGIVAGPIAKAAKPVEAPVTPDPDLARFEGLYRDRWGEYARVAVVGGKLRVIRLEVDDLQRATTTLDRLGRMTFRTHVDELNMGANVEDVIEFTVDSAGRATSFTTESGAYRYHRVEWEAYGRGERTSRHQSGVARP